MIDRLLILGGTSEASELIESLRADAVPSVLSFAGRTAAVSRLPDDDVIDVRVGGFGGPDGLARYLRSERIRAVVCATHPFAARMPSNVAAACSATSIPVVRLLREPWVAAAGDLWIDADSLEAAAAALNRLGVRRVLLTTGRQDLSPFAGLDSIEFVVRSIDLPDVAAFAHAEVVLDRGPFTVDGEAALLRSRRIEAIVSKNSGGTATSAKLVAARRLRVPVVMVQRPAAAAIETVGSVAEVRQWLTELC